MIYFSSLTSILILGVGNLLIIIIISPSLRLHSRRDRSRVPRPGTCFTTGRTMWPALTARRTSSCASTSVRRSCCTPSATWRTTPWRRAPSCAVTTCRQSSMSSRDNTRRYVHRCRLYHSMSLYHKYILCNFYFIYLLLETAYFI